MRPMPSRRSKGGTLVPAVALWLLWAPLFASAEDLKLTVYHTNDIHGWIMARPASWDPQNRHRLIGGAAVLASVLEKEQGPRLLLDAGDWFQGTPEGAAGKGQALVDVFNALAYDAVEVGNHDFDFGEA